MQSAVALFHMYQNQNYSDGSRALRFADDGTGFAYYPSGMIAACVSDANDDTPARVHFFYADGDARRLLGFVSEFANGFANSPQLAREFRWNEKFGDLLQGNTENGLNSVAAPSSTLGASPKRWAQYDINGRRLTGGASSARRIASGAGGAGAGDDTFANSTDGLAVVDKSAADGLGAGVGDGITVERWTWGKPTKIEASRDLDYPLNEHLTFSFRSRQQIAVKFNCDGVRIEFDCSMMVRRPVSYLDDPRTTRGYGGKIKPYFEAPTLVERTALGFAAASARRSLVKPSSKDVANSDIASIMAGLEAHFEPYERKIAQQDWVSTSCAGWKEEALRKTRSEVPTVVPTLMAGKPTEVARSKHVVAGGGHDGSMKLSLVTEDGGASQLGKTWQRRDGKMMTTLEVAAELRVVNPVLPRGQMIRGASGRYSLDAEVERRPTRMKTLKLLNSKNFDSFLTDDVGSDELALVVCLREDDHATGHCVQMLQTLNGQVGAAASRAGTPTSAKGAEGSAGAGAPGGGAADAPLTSFRLAKFEMAESRFMVERYNVLALPCFLMFYQGKPVHAGSMGGKLQRLERDTAVPRVLVVEPNFAEQLSVEQLLRAERPAVLWDLSITGAEARVRQKQLQDSLRQSSRKTRDVNSSYGIVILGSALSDLEVADVVSTVTSALMAGDPKPVFVSLTPRADVKCSRRPRPNALEESLGGASQGGRPRNPLADPRTGCVCFPTSGLLRGGKATAAVLEPLRVAGLHAVTDIWRHQSHVTTNRHNVAARTVGLTEERLLATMRAALAKGRGGEYLSAAAVRRGCSALSVQDPTVQVTLGGSH